MLAAFAALLCCQLAGEAAMRWLGLPVPGPVIGMVLLAILLLTRAPLPRELIPTANGLLQHLSLLFVPAGVGVIQHLDLIANQGARLAIVLVLSVIVTLAVTAVVFAAVARLIGVEDRDAPRGEP